jgi:hypothetical protein
VRGKEVYLVAELPILRAKDKHLHASSVTACVDEARLSIEDATHPCKAAFDPQL